MGPKTKRLGDVLEQTVTLLRAAGETHWADQLGECRRLLLASDYHGIEKLLACFGGMGSFNDVAIVRSQLSALSTEAYELASGIRRERDASAG